MRYIIGIDLGTTNCCTAYVDTCQPQMVIQTLRLPQLVSTGYVKDLKTLPSSCYLAGSQEWPEGSLNLPWKNYQGFFVGAFAREQGARVPTKLVHSAKSWLCHEGAGRKEKILPFEAADEGQRISAVEASSRYLLHIREAWDHVVAKGDIASEFAQQEIVLTVPASFDEIARTLTLEAAKLAGFSHITLLEEPQATFYSWISQHENKLSQIDKKLLSSGDNILVCDVGGGTTDFSLIEVVESAGELGFQRLAVGEHLLLGGDNMDAALAHYLEAKLQIQSIIEITPFQWLQIKHQAREAKEVLLSDNSETSFRITIQTASSHIIQNTLSATIEKKEIETFLEEGFWKNYAWDDAIAFKKSSGFRSIGLPYEEEPSITKHLARFLKQSFHPVKGLPKPDFVLFNGGALKPSLFQSAILSSLKCWFPDKIPKVLESCNLDLAVARGAVYYGKVRRGFGIRIGGGSARGYYLAVDAGGQNGIAKAMTLLPRGSEEGSAYEISQIFSVLPNTPVAFRLYSSHVRLYDKVEDLIAIAPQEMQLLPPIHTMLRYGKGTSSSSSKEKISVRLNISLTEVGTLELCLKSVNSEHRWKLEFQLRKESGQDDSLSILGQVRKDETFDASFLQGAQKIIQAFYNREISSKSPHIIELLENHLEKPKREWSLSILRGLWDELSIQASKRRISQEMESRWWNLAGFFLRPGFGFPLDDSRLKELWKVILTDNKLDHSSECLIQMWICYRRISGGLNKGQQTQLAADLLAKLYPTVNSKMKIKNKNELYFYNEKIRTLASMEFIEISQKIKLGQAILSRIKSDNPSQSELWALGRLGARQLAYGSLVNVLPREVCSQWVEDLLSLPHLDKGQASFVFGQLARKTELRELNLPLRIIDKILAFYDNSPHKERLTSLLLTEGRLSTAEQETVFGDQLPLGISFELMQPR